MIVSKVFPTLIRLNYAIKLSTHPRTKLSNSSKHLWKIHHFENISLQSRGMSSSDIDKDLNDPKRHFDYDQLIKKKDNDNVVIIDVREHSEINETGKIPGSIHIPLAEVEKALGELPPEEFKKLYNMNKPHKDNEIVFSCKAGGRSLKALKMGLKLGYSKAGNYKGGWLDWAEKSKS